MARHLTGHVSESVETLQNLIDHTPGARWHGRIRFLIYVREHPDMTLEGMAGHLGVTDRQLRRWWKEYREGGLEGLIGRHAQGMETTAVSIAAHKRGDGSVPEGFISFLNALPTDRDVIPWVKKFRDALMGLLGDVDRIVANVDVAFDPSDTEPATIRVVTSQHVNRRGRGGARMQANTSVENIEVDLFRRELEKENFPFQDYHEPFIVHYDAPSGRIGSLMFLRERERKPFLPATLKLIDRLQPFIIFALTDCVARASTATNSVAMRDFPRLMDAVAVEYGLSLRQRQILIQSIVGYDQQEIADRLHISRDTVRKHVGNIYGKAGVGSMRELIGRLLLGTEHDAPPS